jgi:hypothetical protein
MYHVIADGWSDEESNALTKKAVVQKGHMTSDSDSDDDTEDGDTDDDEDDDDILSHSSDWLNDSKFNMRHRILSLHALKNHCMPAHLRV